jgi:tRNA1Val (adenine37-N6)-methyltransferase
MKVGTDGVLLGAWAEVSGCRTALDAGAGSGLISLMLAQRCEKARVDGVEIDTDACAQAAENVAASPFAERIRLYCSAFDAFVRQTPQRYDLIVSNSPYFARSMESPDGKRRLARQGNGLSLSDLFSGSARLLKPGGRLSLILPYDRRDKLAFTARAYGWYCVRRTRVLSLPGSLPKRLLSEWTRQPAPLTESELALEDAQRRRSEDYRQLTHDFYLYTSRSVFLCNKKGM